MFFPKVIFQAVGGKPEKKRAALAHFDTILGLDQVMVQLTIRAVLVSLVMMMIKKKLRQYLNQGWIICWPVVPDELPTRQQEEGGGKEEQFSGDQYSKCEIEISNSYSQLNGWIYSM